MKIFNFIFVFTFLCSVSNAAERVAVQIPSDEETQVQNLMEKLENAVVNEDFKGYLSCFTKDLSSKNKKKMSALFLQHDIEMDLEKFSITDSTEDSIEFTAKYSVDVGGDSNTIVSSIVAKKIDDDLVISSEEIISKISNNRRRGQNNNFDMPNFGGIPNDNCPDGNCPLVVNPGNPFLNNPQNKEEDGEKKEVWVPMFNNAQGQPDENGPMWVDPMVMVRMFPDKYPPSCGGKCEKVNPKFR
jgi:hypothetical protein